ncbi:DUF4139 domain-containing protein [Roseospira visakhapatnamensis]|uniref:DUF4139 domain-containing protein n=1 Tax=Roseospira visakhapatnamensis TaxID=390880 RepID=A0A7W6RAE9_9PROT|nr:DUF4139 domain-containing protein [Roseospira visakhapatnamensis]MBB4264847.1 hypothetical protein [Roseospira visakhapatnamensis]
MPRRLLLSTAAALLAASPAFAAEIAVPPGGPGSVALTIHGNHTALVRETRAVTLPAGESDLAFPEVPGTADATSVRLAPADDGASMLVLERSLAADVPNLRRLLELSVGREIGLLVADQGADAPPRRATATVLSVTEDVVLEMDGAIRIGLPGDVVLDSLPEGLRPSPTLLASVETETAGPRSLALTYLAGGLGWSADYTLDVTAAMDGADLAGWATLTNTSGRTFTDAALTLAAGQVAVASHDDQFGGRGIMRADMEMAASMAPAPKAEAQGGQHFYPLKRPVTLAHRQTRQVALAHAPDIAVTARHVVPAVPHPGLYVDPGAEDTPVHASRHLVLTNTTDTGLGVPLPAGVVRVYQAGPDGGPRFLGADRIDHLAVGGEAILTLGEDFDVTAERRRTAYRRLGDRLVETDHTVTLLNGKPDRDIEVRVEATLPGDWAILDESADHERVTARRVVWTVPVPASGEVTLSYTVRTQY